jgi:hypothetical protein
MAILRGGTKIFGQDIRIGIPRDKSLTDVVGNLKEKQGGSGKLGGNPTSTINTFIAQINQGEGMARPNRYLVKFFLPQKKKLGRNDAYDYGAYTPSMNQMDSMDMQRNVGMMANKVTMPSRDVNTTDVRTFGPRRKMPYAYSFNGNTEMTFYGDKFLRQRHFFENWQEKIFNIYTHEMNFYEDYVGKIHIYQIGADDQEGGRDRITYAVELDEVYPETIGQYDLSYGDNDKVAELPITFAFRTWMNLSKDDINTADVGVKFGDIPEVKASKDFGLFGGFLDKLPPELRRTGRDVLGAVKRSTPIGKITGGRVFPPFL